MAISSLRDAPDNWTDDSIPSLSGKTAIVTGGNSGIGFETALQLAKHGAHVILACRNASKAEEAAARIRAEIGVGAGGVETMILDVSSQESVKAFADNFKKSNDKLDLLINNAGICAVAYGTTVDGHERQFATNHLGHFTLTALLFESLKKAATDARVVNVTSLTNSTGGIVPTKEIMVSDESKYSPNGVYAQSKLYNLVFSMELTRRMKAAGISGISSVACHPGFTRTNLAAEPLAEKGWLAGLRVKFLYMLPIWQETTTGALPTLYAATGSNVESGDYYGPGGFQALWGSPKREQPAKVGLAEEFARDLWEESEKLANIKFDLK